MVQIVVHLLVSVTGLWRNEKNKKRVGSFHKAKQIQFEGLIDLSTQLYLFFKTVVRSVMILLEPFPAQAHRGKCEAPAQAAQSDRAAGACSSERTSWEFSTHLWEVAPD